VNRIERISAILIQLQSKQVVTAQEIADRFEISLRTVYRDMKALEETGVPIVAEAGTGYSIMEGYKLPPVHFSINEATAMLTAEKLIEKLTDTGINKDYKSALLKIKAILRSTEKKYLETIEDHIEVVKNRYVPDESKDTDYLQKIISAISTKSILKLEYLASSSGEISLRNIEPVGIFFLGNRWLLIAYCRLRKDYRNFRLDRFRALTATTETYQTKHPALKSFLDKMSKEEKLHKVVIEIENEVVRYLGEQKFYNGYVHEKKGKVKTEMTFLTPSLEGFARWYLMIGDHTRIVSPPELKDRIKVILTAVSKNIK
jgi:predicted DNA-binding transcriptional regulator YafY